MCDFERVCKDCGHISYGARGKCEECSSVNTRLYSMDGHTASELRAMEADEAKANKDEEDNEEEQEDEE